MVGIFRTLSLSVLVLLALVSCALPKPPKLTTDEERTQRAADLARQGLDYYSRGRFFEAERSFRLAMLTSSVSPALEFNLALSLEQEGSLQEAASLLESLTLRAPKEPLYWAARGRIDAAQNKFEEAYEAYDASIKAARAVVDESFDVRGLLIAKSAVAGVLGRVDEAICSSEEAYLANPSAGDFDRHIRVIMNFGRLQQAFTRATNAIRTKEIANPSNELIRTIAFYFIQQGRCEDAVRWIERAARSGVPDSGIGLDFDLALMRCGKAPLFFGREPTVETVSAALKEQYRGRNAFGQSWPPEILRFALEVAQKPDES